MAIFSLGYRLRRTISRLARGNPSFIVNAVLRELPDGLKRALFRGDRYHCPVCDSHLRSYVPRGEQPLRNALCPVCGSFGRLRWVMRFFQSRTDLFTRPQRLLHFAPERQMIPKLSSISTLDYVTADLSSPLAREHFDITKIPYPDASFDAIYCSHVLEHVPDDRKAMRELRRVLRPGGWALILVPVRDSPTIEDPSITDPLERERLFGQFDHVRFYGPDFRDRLEEAGFRVEVIDPRSIDAQGAIGNWEEIAPREINYCT